MSDFDDINFQFRFNRENSPMREKATSFNSQVSQTSVTSSPTLQAVNSNRMMSSITQGTATVPMPINASKVGQWNNYSQPSGTIHSGAMQYQNLASYGSFGSFGKLL